MAEGFKPSVHSFEEINEARKRIGLKPIDTNVTCTKCGKPLKWRMNLSGKICYTCKQKRKGK
jgi:hypothetical protein